MIASCHPCRPGPAADFQNKLYAGKRLFTNGVKSRCTVCGREANKTERSAPTEGPASTSTKKPVSVTDRAEKRKEPGRDKQQSRPGSRR